MLLTTVDVRGDGMAPEGHLVAGRYRLLRVLAVGGMSRVWLADDELLGRQVAIKKCALPAGLSTAERAVLGGLTMREARAFAQVSDPHVIRILDVLPGAHQPWLVMEYVASRSLLEVIRDAGRLPPARAATVGLAVLRGLIAAGRAGVLHADVKPANVLIGDDGRIVLADFGPAVTPEGIRTLAGAGIVLGSPKYVAPERLSGGGCTPESDLWSLGATLYHAVEGRPPYVRESTEETLRAIVDGAPDPPRHAGPLLGVLTGLLRHDPAERLRPSEVEERLREIAEEPGAAVPPARARRFAGRPAAVAAALAVLAALGGAAAVTRPDGPAGDRPAVAASPAPRAPFVLPRGYWWWADAGDVRVAVPTGWRRGPDAAGVLFRPAGGVPSLRISRWVAPPQDVVAALVTEERDVRLGSYRRLRIEALSQPPNAVWEYTFREPGGEPMRGLRRVLSVNGDTYVLEWQAPRDDWATALPKLAVVLASFGPA
ncbi:serine/threonine-protein kinase [Actinoplanes sp. NPDC049599]|uniref:serine/threonine-protein kinase n=1 Tax=Actinoplanes sp. NPDC049599 TaxID=3363903 RepID=UPI0037880F06